MLVYDATNAFYIVHSFPLFPAMTSSGTINSTINYSQTVYGQNMMCVSMPTSTLYELAGIMSVIQASVYYTNIKISNANVTRFTSGLILDNLSTGSYQFSVAGTSYVYISKSQYSGLDLWDIVVAGYYQQGLYVQSWGRPYMASVCPPLAKYTTLNISGLKIANATWAGTQDHSKWGIPTSTKVVCYGDMNRMTSQRTRGGGALCMANSNLYDLHFGVITNMDPCGTP